MKALVIASLVVSLTGCTILSEPASTSSDPYTTDGKLLKQWCTTPDLSIACNFYIGGVVDGAALQAEITDQALPYCAPDPMKYGQAIEVVTQYLNDHPDYLQQHASVLIMFALRAAFPCQN